LRWRVACFFIAVLPNPGARHAFVQDNDHRIQVHLPPCALGSSSPKPAGDAKRFVRDDNGALDDVGAAFAPPRCAIGPQLTYAFPGFNCISVNDEVARRPRSTDLRPGDVLKIDVTAELDGYIADSAITVVFRRPTPRANNLASAPKPRSRRPPKVAERGAHAELGRPSSTKCNGGDTR
jgi:hypothetical protein